jgi:hypothetical protein
VGRASPFEPGMFVAQVQGKLMEPEIPDGAYCLFRLPRAGSRQGRRVIVWHAGIHDPMTSGHYTVKVYTSEKVSVENNWHHTRIVQKPLNPDYESIVLTAKDEGDIRIVGGGPVGPALRDTDSAKSTRCATREARFLAQSDDLRAEVSFQLDERSTNLRTAGV